MKVVLGKNWVPIAFTQGRFRGSHSRRAAPYSVSTFQFSLCVYCLALLINNPAHCEVRSVFRFLNGKKFRSVGFCGQTCVSDTDGTLKGGQRFMMRIDLDDLLSVKNSNKKFTRFVETDASLLPSFIQISFTLQNQWFNKLLPKLMTVSAS